MGMELTLASFHPALRRDCMSSADRTSSPAMSLGAPTELHTFTVDGHSFAVVAAETPSQEALPPSMILATFTAGGRRVQIIPRPVEPPLPPTKQASLPANLTARELQIVQLVATGHSNKLISKHLQISEWTVSSHLRRIFLKLGVETRAQMVHVCALGLLAQS